MADQPTDTKRDIVKPLLALAMGLLPFALFGGSTSRVEVNGEVVSESSLNLLGLGLAVAGIIFAWRSLAATGGNRALRSTLAGITMAVCVIQLPLSAGLVSLDGIRTAVTGKPPLPPVSYEGLNEETEQMARNIVADNDRAYVENDIVNRYASMLGDLNEHVAYADFCHGGQYRVDVAERRALPDIVTPEMVATIEERMAFVALSETPECSESNTQRYMAEKVGRVRHSRDVLAIEVAAYSERFGDG
ncbi:hypothetical protein [Inquilinus sp. CAU 1745]|uniref:hypothetical protein n=1 Tax=Inquilinus sp. CAU 1745 TaxID=3140369 RepID=UPI00325BC9AC